mmetsp:Transcript_5052/g.16939  ORF Transcript_5052/g.16939 Transcript_5052/m.16939 type:complete len:286 (+) Transcript_5052:21-878(+)
MVMARAAGPSTCALAIALISLPGAVGVQWAMDEAERAAFDSVVTALLSPAAEPLFVEWGAGGSTRRVLELVPRAQVYSVDNSRVWLDMVANDVNHSPNFHPVFVQLGPEADNHFGFPRSQPSAEERRAYSTAHNERLPRAQLVLIDGRMRVRCALEAARLVGPGALVMVHDFWPRVSAYGILLGVFDMWRPGAAGEAPVGAGDAGTALQPVRFPADAVQAHNLIMLQPKPPFRQRAPGQLVHDATAIRPPKRKGKLSNAHGPRQGDAPPAEVLRALEAQYDEDLF